MENCINEQQLELLGDLSLSGLCSNAVIIQKELEKRATLVQINSQNPALFGGGTRSGDEVLSAGR
jgi:hypothetical protein